MNDVPENELFSAYLDGELTADEQADVERLLARSPAARQLLDELRALSSNLQALPQYTLDEDLSERVVRIAERKILTRAEQLTKPAAQRPSLPAAQRPSLPAALPRPPLIRRLIESRALAWSGLAVAVALMLMFIPPPPDQPAGDDELARGPEAADETDEADRGPEFEMRARPDEPVGGKNGRWGMADGRRGEASPRSGDSFGEGEFVDIDDKAKLNRGDLALKGAVGSGGGLGGGTVESKPGGAKRLSTGTTDPAGPGTADGGGAGHGTLPDIAANSADEPPAAGFPGKGDGPGWSNGGYAGAAQPGGQDETDLAAQLTLRGGQLYEHALLDMEEAGTLVVHCDISPEAARDEVFVNLLATNGIALTDEENAAGDAVLDKLAEVRPGRDLSHLQKKQNGKAAPPQRKADARDAQYVYAVASREQIVGVLAALSASEGSVLSLSVDPDPGTPEQKNLRRYNRSTATRRPRPIDEQEAMQFGAGTQNAPGELRAKAPDQRRSGLGDDYEGEAAGQAWRIDRAEARSKLEQVTRRGGNGRGRQHEAVQEDSDSQQPARPQTGPTLGGQLASAIAKGVSGKTVPEPDPETARQSQSFRDAPDTPPPPAPAVTRPSPAAEPATQAPGADRPAPAVPAEPPMVPPPVPAPVKPAEQGKPAESPPAEAHPSGRPAETPLDAKPSDKGENEEGADAKDRGQGQLQAAPQEPRPGETSQAVQPAKSTQTPQPKSEEGEKSFGSELREKLAPPRQELARQEVPKYRTLFVLRIVGTGLPGSAARINASIEAAEEPPASPADATKR